MADSMRPRSGDIYIVLYDGVTRIATKIGREYVDKEDRAWVQSQFVALSDFIETRRRRRASPSDTSGDAK